MSAAVPLAGLLALSVGAPGRYAVIIGNNQGRADEVALRFAQQDATRMASVLRRLGGVPAQNLTVLLGEDAGSIRRAVLDINARIRQENAPNTETMLFVYYSGHADAQGLHPGDSALSYRELKAMITGSSARARVLVLDGCRSGGLTNVKGAGPAQEFALVDNSGGVQGVAMISSSAAGEDSQESERLGASFFSHHLINAFVGAGDKNNDGQVTLNEAYKYAYHNTLRSSGRTISLQHPTYAFDLKGRGELMMTELRSGLKGSARLVLDRPGRYLILREREGGEVIAELSAARPETLLALPPGRYFVQRRGADRYREYEVELAAEQEVALASRPFKEVGYARLVRKGTQRRAAHAAMVLVSGRGAVLQGQGPAAAVLAGYELSLPWATVGARIRFGQTLTTRLDEGLEVRHRELGLGLLGQRLFDLPYVSLGLGLWLEAVYHRQTLQGVLPPAPRTSWGLNIGVLLSAEVELYGPLLLRAEGGPVTYLLRRTQTSGGEIQSESLSSSVTGWGGLGLGWRF